VILAALAVYLAWRGLDLIIQIATHRYLARGIERLVPVGMVLMAAGLAVAARKTWRHAN
jgi:hypothetical protein